MKHHTIAVCALVVLAGMVQACGGDARGPQATAQALADTINQTATASGQQVDASGSLQTAEAEATARSEGLDATQAAQVAQTAEAAEATTTALEPIIAELPTYGVDPSEGEPGWIHPPVTLTADGPNQAESANRFLATVVGDFVISADITWDTTSLAFCGFAVRSDGNEDAPNQYLITITRTGNGTLTFITQEDGAFFYREGITANVMDPTFQWQNGTTNRLTVVGRGDTFTMYTNGRRVTEEVASEFDRGFVAMVAFNQSGRTTCQFDNAWLWLLD